MGILALIDGVQPIFASDFHLFENAGRVLLSDEALNVYNDPSIQVGPIHLLFNGIIHAIASLFVIQSQVLLSVVVQVGYVIALILIARRLLEARGKTSDSWTELGLAALTVALAVAWRTFFFGHVGEAFIPLLWILSADLASRNRFRTAGLVLAAAGGIELWGLFGLVMLVLTARSRAVASAVGIALVGALLIYAPFLLFGSVHTFSFARPVSSGSVLVGMFTEQGEGYTWVMRLIQGLVVIGAGLALAVCARRRGSIPDALWLVPVGMAGARLLLDPSAAIYLWLPFQTAALVGVAIALAPRRSFRDIALAVAVYPLFLEPTTGFLGAWAVGLAVVALSW